VDSGQSAPDPMNPPDTSPPAMYNHEVGEEGFGELAGWSLGTQMVPAFCSCIVCIPPAACILCSKTHPRRNLN
jgi:hypothetical protein